MNNDFVEKNTIYKCLAGSKAYGLDTPTSDTDIRGICIPPKEYYFGLHSFEQQELPPDIVIYSIQKFIRLATDCNPNVIELLYVDKNDILSINNYGKILRDNRELFLSKKAKFTFSGYAFAQLQRIKGHHKWITNPQTEPNKYDFIIEKTVVLADGSQRFFTKFLEQEYDIAYKKYQQYIDWKKNRNEQRSGFEAQFGYDTKHAMHLVRLMRMGLEILKEGKVIVKRPDRADLLGLKLNGNRTYDQLIEEANYYQEELDVWYEKSSLPKTPDTKKINDLLITLTTNFLKENELQK
jgi:uncharacterized protein